MSIDIKTAVRNALEFVREMYAEDDDLKDLALEEVERSEDGTRWLVTVGMGGEDRASTMSVVAGAGAPRQYKRVAIDLAAGDVLSMKAVNR